MQFIGRLFGLSPDRGSGLLEFYLVAIPLTLLLFRVILGHRSRWRVRSHPHAKPGHSFQQVSKTYEQGVHHEIEFAE